MQCEDAVRLRVVCHLVEDKRCLGCRVHYLALGGVLARVHIHHTDGAWHERILVERGLVGIILVAYIRAGCSDRCHSCLITIVAHPLVGIRIGCIKLHKSGAVHILLIAQLTEYVSLAVLHIVNILTGLRYRLHKGCGS